MIVTGTFRIKKVLQNRDITFGCCFLSVIILPVYVYYLPPVMILWGLAWLAENKLTFTKKMFIHNNASVLFILFMILYLWQISGLVLADSFSSGFERIFKRLSFLLFPLVLFYPGERIINNIKLIVRLFAIGTLVYMIYCMGNALYESLSLKDGIWIFNPHPPIYDYENYFYSYRLSEPAHPSYIAMYVVLSLLISLESIFDKSFRIVRRILWSMAVIILLIALYLLSSRAGFLACSIVTVVFLLLKLSGKLHKLVTLALVIIITVSFLVIARQNARINDFMVSISSDNIGEVIEKDIRYTIWKSSFNALENNIILGVGTGNASNELKKEFISNGYEYGYYDNLNAHNQYLEILLENGIIGLLIFMCLLGFMIYIAVKQGNILFGLFILMMLIFFFFETILNRLAGITFFPLFTFLLFYYPSDRVKAY